MASTSCIDPGASVQEVCAVGWEQLREAHAQWIALVEADPRAVDEIVCSGSEIISDLRSIEWDLADLEDTVSIIKGNATKYAALLEGGDGSVLATRVAFIGETRRRMDEIKAEVTAYASGDAAGYRAKKSGAVQLGKARGYGKLGGELEMGAVPAPGGGPGADADAAAATLADEAAEASGQRASRCWLCCC